MARAKEQPTEKKFYNDAEGFKRAIAEEQRAGALKKFSVVEAVIILDIYREAAAKDTATDALLRVIEAAFLLGYQRGRAEK